MKIYLSEFLGFDPQRYELLKMMNKELTNMEIIELKKDYIKYKWNDKILVLTRPDLNLDPDYIEINIDNLTDNKNLTITASLESELPPVPSELVSLVTPVTVFTINRKESILKQENNGIRICSEENACSFVYNSLIDDYHYMENSVMYTDEFYDSQVVQLVMEENKSSQIIKNPLQVYKQTIEEFAIVPDHQFQFQVFMSFQDEKVLPITIRMTDCPDYNYELERPSSGDYSYMKTFSEIGYFDFGHRAYLNKVKKHIPSKKIVLSSKNRKFYR